VSSRESRPLWLARAGGVVVFLLAAVLLASLWLPHDVYWQEVVANRHTVWGTVTITRYEDLQEFGGYSRYGVFESADGRVRIREVRLPDDFDKPKVGDAVLAFTSGPSARFAYTQVGDVNWFNVILEFAVLLGVVPPKSWRVLMPRLG
jgi:hypothetical protein